MDWWKSKWRIKYEKWYKEEYLPTKDIPIKIVDIDDNNVATLAQGDKIFSAKIMVAGDPKKIRRQLRIKKILHNINGSKKIT